MDIRYRKHYPALSDLYRDVDRNLALVEEAYKDEQVTYACREGCSACCSQLVVATRWEAEGLVSFLNALDASLKETLWQQLASWYAAFRPHLPELPGARAGWEKFAESYRALDLPCPFLMEGSCAVYPVRPVACRMLYVAASPPCADPKGEIDQLAWFEEAIEPAMEYLSRRSEAGVFPLLVAIAMTR